MQRFRLPAVILCGLLITLLAGACSPDATPTLAPTPTPETQEWEPILGTTLLRTRNAARRVPARIRLRARARP